MIFDLVIHIWTCEACKKLSGNNIWKWELSLNPYDPEDRQKLQFMEMAISQHCIKNKHEIVHRTDESQKFHGRKLEL